jgi:DNA-directed RNA polymerase sigma subunit (sigma70/sigma32)
MRRKNQARNLEIFQARESGEKLKAIGDRYGISPERVRQLHLIEKLRQERSYSNNSLTNGEPNGI